MDAMSDLIGLTHPTFGRKKMSIPNAAGRTAPWMKKKGATDDGEEMAEKKKSKKLPGIGGAIRGKKKGKSLPPWLKK